MAKSRDRLVSRTDHAALLAACREVLAHRGTYRADPGVHGVPADVRWSFPDAKDPGLPVAIRALTPCKLTVEDDYVRVVLCPGGYSGLDVIGFREGIDRELDGGRGRGHRLVPGLWYYENWGD